MKLDTFSYSTASGWSDEPLADFDSENTLLELRPTTSFAASLTPTMFCDTSRVAAD